MLEVEDLHAYYAKSHILQGVSFRVGAGEIVSLLGRNGAGRSTAVKTLIGLVPPVGAIRFRGERIDGMKPHEIAIMATGTQGEPGAVLGRMAVGKHPVINVEPGDTIVMSAHPIPGNEEYIHRIINRLFQKGANVLYDPVAKVHVSGHASQEEQKLLMSLIRPKHFIPIHGELRMLKAHAGLAHQMGINSTFVVENGTPVVFNNGEAEQLERLPGGYVFVDGSGVGDIGKAVIRDRDILSRDGFVLAIVRRDDKGGLAEAPEIITRGFIYMKESESLVKGMSDAVKDALKDMGGAMSESTIKDKTTDALNKYINAETRRRPMIIPVVG